MLWRAMKRRLKMKIKNNLIISFGKCAIEVEEGDKQDIQGNFMHHISNLSPRQVRILREIFPEEIRFIEGYMEGKKCTKYCLYKEEHNG